MNQFFDLHNTLKLHKPNHVIYILRHNSLIASGIKAHEIVAKEGYNYAIWLMVSGLRVYKDFL